MMVGIDEVSGESRFGPRRIIRDKLVKLADGKEVTLVQGGAESKDTLDYYLIRGTKKNMGIHLSNGQQLPLGAVKDAYVSERRVELKPHYQYGASQ